MTGEILNPVRWENIASDMTEAEKLFAECLARGKSCVLGDAVPQAQESGAHNTIRSEVIRFFSYGGNEEHPVLGKIIELHGAWISGGYALNLAHADIPYALGFGKCHFAVPVIMQRAECAALYLDGSYLARGLDADGLTTRGDVFLRDKFSAEGEVRLLNANIGGNLDCEGGKFHNLGKDALAANELNVKGSVNLRDGFFAEGKVLLLGANIGGNLDCAGGEFHNLGKDALVADGLTTKGAVHLSDGFSAEGEVRFVGADIGGNLNCKDGRFYNPGKDALTVEKLTTKGDVNLRGRFSAKGQVLLLGANIGGNLDCEGGKFHNPRGYALMASRLVTAGGVLLRNEFSAEGRVGLAHASIGADLDCVNGRFHCPAKEGARGYALTVQGSSINGSFWWRQILGEGTVNLRYAKAGILMDDVDAWALFKVALVGFTYGQFANLVDAQSRIDWLAKRPDGMPFSPLPYEQAAKVLRAMGKDIDAWGIEREKNRLQREFDGVSLFRKFGGWLLDTLKDAGYYPSRIVKWGLCVMAFGAAVFACADYHGNIVPTHPVVAFREEYWGKIAPNGDMRPTQAVPPEYPAFNPFVFSLDVFTPSAVFHQEDSWGPRSGGGDWLDFDIDILWLLTLWYWLEVAMGWILTSMLLLSVTGLLRPR